MRPLAALIVAELLGIVCSWNRYAIGIPCFVIFAVARKRHNLEESRPSLGFLFTAYYDRFWYWEGLRLLRNVRKFAERVGW